MSDLIITPLPAFKDNYIWLLTRGNEAAVVDPGDAEPVIRALEGQQLRLTAILATHHHADHVGGLVALKQRYSATAYGPARESVAQLDHRLTAGDRIECSAHAFDVIDIPGHTAGHIAFHAAALKPPAVFCGDTLFACGCGRLFEGTPEQMLASLDTLAELPAATRVYCGHEYTVANIRFALEVEPNNRELQTRAAMATAMRKRGEPTLPSTIGLELETNPFMRCDVPSVRAAASAITPGAGFARVSTFAAIRSLEGRIPLAHLSERRRRRNLTPLSTSYLNWLEPCRFFNMRLSRRSATFWFAFGICCTCADGLRQHRRRVANTEPGPESSRIRPRPASPPPAVTSFTIFFTRHPMAQRRPQRRLPSTPWSL